MALSMNGINVTGKVSMKKASAGFDPVAFWSGQLGGMWDFTNPAGLFSNVGLTTPAVVDGLVRGVTDLSGLNQPVRSTYLGVTAFPFTMKSGYCLADQGGGMATQPITNTGSYTAFALVKSNSVTTLQNLVDSDYTPTFQARVSQNIIFTASSQLETYIFGFTPPDNYQTSPTLVTNTDYFTAVAVNGSGADMRIGGVLHTPGGNGGINPGPAAVAIAASFGSTASPQYQIFGGRIYCAAWINKKCTTQEITDIGNYMNSLAGISAAV